MLINSTSNNKIKNILKLKKSTERKKQGIFVVEGEREIKIALKAGLSIESLYLCQNYNKNKENIRVKETIYLSKEVFDKISYRDSPDGNIALFHSREESLKNVFVEKKSLFVVLEGIEKPGNLGAIMRTIDAAKVDGVILNSPGLDIYNPNCIRASQGTIFTTPVFVASIEETISFCEKNNIEIFATTPSAKEEYTERVYLDKTALLFGSEDKGLSEKWLKIVKNKIKIEMKGEIDSLNLSVTVAVLVFEAIRQRKKLMMDHV